MKLRFPIFLAVVVALVSFLTLIYPIRRVSTEQNPAPAGSASITKAEFKRLMETLADGWNEGNARKAANCFTEHAIYTEPPDKQLYRGREELFKFFGGDEGRKGQMKMQWHHLIYDEQTGIGAGEFTFDYGGAVHGMVIVRIQNAKINNWREYWYESPLSWEKFTEKNPF